MWDNEPVNSFLSREEIQLAFFTTLNSLPHNCNNISNRDEKEKKKTTSVERSEEIHEVVHRDFRWDTSENPSHWRLASVRNI